MNETTMYKRQISIIRTIGAVVMGLTLVALVNLLPLSVAAQEPVTTETPVLPFSPETLAAFGLSAQDIQAAGVLTFDLEIAKTASAISVTAGNPVVYTIVITNRGPNPMQGLLFKDYLPVEMPNANFSFSEPDVISDGATIPLWYINQKLISGSHTTINVTGILTSPYSKIVTNRAEVTPLFPQGEITPTNNSAQVGVNVVGSSSLRYVYFPLVFKNPIILYSQDFATTSHGWVQFPRTNNCEGKYASDTQEYRVEAYDKNKSCLVFAPLAAEFYDGEFEVYARRTGGTGSYGYGIYINGNGDNNYYLLRVKPNASCGWELIRRQGGANTQLGQGGCTTPPINTGSSTNKLAIKHITGGLIVAYINNTPVYTGTQTWFGGKGTGLYIVSGSESDVTGVAVRFDNFKVTQRP